MELDETMIFTAADQATANLQLLQIPVTELPHLDDQAPEGAFTQGVQDFSARLRAAFHGSNRRVMGTPARSKILRNGPTLVETYSVSFGRIERRIG